MSPTYSDWSANTNHDSAAESIKKLRDQVCLDGIPTRVYDEFIMARSRYGVTSQRTLEEHKTAARVAGLILCDCIWVNDVRTIWVPPSTRWRLHGGGLHASALLKRRRSAVIGQAVAAVLGGLAALGVFAILVLLFGGRK